MTSFLWSCAALFSLFVAVEPLSCYTCDVNILGYCLREAPVNCTTAQDRCVTAVAKFSGHILDIHERGCIENSTCDDSSGTVLTVKYNITRTCCSTSLCNGAGSPRRPLAAALAASLVAAWSL
ncbi:prostate stem cell antigen-like [Pungitius pungitius]|uniref:prostate stem cell antigen-like n=1 Tax=Pungitius pungitius TaxID=134920 RepID=UPI002E1678FC